MQSQSSTISPPDAQEQSQAKKAYVAAGIGWGLDGLTWTIYGFALTAVGPVLGFTSSTAGWITAISIVASAVGGALGGVLADRFGRIRTLTWVILGYCLFTGLTATSQDVTQFATWRVLEGLAFGAEWAVGAALVSEYAPAHKRGRILSAIHSCYAVGWALSTAIYLWVFSVANPAVGWRYLFFIGVIPAIVAFWIRRSVKDKVQVTKKPKGTKLPLTMLFSRAQIRTTLLATLLGMGVQGIYYSVFVFLPSFLKTERGMTVVGTATYTWVVIIGSFIGYVVSGHIHDKFGRRPTFTFFFLASIASIVLFILTPAAQPMIALPICFLLGFFASGQAGGLGAYLAELFPTEMRATGQGFAYNVGRGVAAFGPLSIGLFTATLGLGNSIMAVGAIGATLALIAVWALPETRNKDILAVH